MEEQFIPITLPSKCKSYQNIDPAKIAIRPFKGKDEALIAELTLDNIKKKLSVIFKNIFSLIYNFSDKNWEWFIIVLLMDLILELWVNKLVGRIGND